MSDRQQTDAHTLSPQTLSALIGAIYDCVLDPSRWDQTLTNITDALETHTAALSLTDLRGDRFLIFRTVGIEPYWLAQAAKHVPEMHAVLSQALGSWPSLDEPHVISRHVPRAYVETSPYFQQCLKPQGIVDVIQYFILQTPLRLAGFGMARHERQGIITDREIKLGGLLLPHIRRAVMISDVLDVKTIERARMAEALDALRCAVMLIDARGTVLHANGAAEAMLRDGSIVHGAGGVLRAKAPAAAAELGAAIGLAAQDEARIGKTGLAIRLTESDVPPIFAHVLPLTGSDLRTRLQPAAVAGVFIGAPPDARDGAEVTAAAYDLTPAETRVLTSLLAGRTLAQTAAALDVAPATAKSHLDRIFFKTGVSRQVDLMRLASGLVPPTKG